jgi:hypothetical protein
VCEAPTSRYCICGASFAHTTVGKELDIFVKFVRDAKNPCLRSDDPQDQYDFARLFSELSNRHGGVACPPVPLLRVIFLGATTGNPEATAALSRAAFRGLTAFAEALRRRIERGLPVFRAGQCPGGALRQVAAEVAGFSRNVAPALAKVLTACTHRATAAERERAIADAVRQVTQCAAFVRAARPARGKKRAPATTAVMGGTYRRKRFCELLFLAVSVGCAGWHMLRRDCDAAGGDWPVADGTVQGLCRIWPNLTSQRRFREALRALQRALKPGDVDMPSIAALLCFGEKQRKRIIEWS